MVLDGLIRPFLVLALLGLWPSLGVAQVTAPQATAGTISWGAGPVLGTFYTLKCGTQPGGPYTITKSTTGTPAPTSLKLVDVFPASGAYWCVVTASNPAALIPESGPSPESALLVTLPSGLVAAYALDELTGPTVQDASGNGNTGTVRNAVLGGAGKYGASPIFNGTNARLDIPDSPSLRLTTGMTLMAWVNPSVITAAWRDVIYKGNAEYILIASTDHAGGAPAVGVSNTPSSQPVFGPGPLPVNTWSHLAGTYDGATLRLYVNGVQVASGSRAGPIAGGTTAPVRIGADTGVWHPTPSQQQWFQGQIDEVRIYNRALSPTELQTAMLTPIGPPLPPPVLVAPQVAQQCQLVITGPPPDASVGWSMQALNGGTPIGAVDPTPPYTRSVVLPSGPYAISLSWTKAGIAPLTSPATSGICP